MSESVVVTGLGVVSPLNADGDAERFWAALRSGENAVRGIRSFDASPYPCKVAAEIPREALSFPDKETDPVMQISLIAFQKALQEARLTPGDIDPRRTGVVVGTVLGGVLSGERYIRSPGSDVSRAKALLLQYPLRAIASRLARAAKFTGVVLTVSTACASGTDAIGIAYRKIRDGTSEAIVAGGVDVLSEFSFSGFCALNALAPDKVRPFSRNRAGLALGEGAAFLLLEREKTALTRGARILGRIAGFASTSDSTHLTAPDREGRGLSAAATAAIREAGLTAGEIDYVNAHGTGTLYNDWMETKALKAALGAHATAVPVSSIKAVLGHAFGAAGAMEAAACLFAIRDRVVPPTANFEEPDPECDIDCVPIIERSVNVRAALSLSAGFGGQNAALLIRRYA